MNDLSGHSHDAQKLKFSQQFKKKGLDSINKYYNQMSNKDHKEVMNLINLRKLNKTEVSKGIKIENNQKRILRKSPLDQLLEEEEAHLLY